MKNEALSALVVLGFDKKASEKALDKVLKENQNIELDALIKNTLKSL